MTCCTVLHRFQVTKRSCQNNRTSLSNHCLHHSLGLACFWNIFFPQHGETVNIFFQSLTHFITGLIKSGIVNTSLQNNSDFHSAFTRFSLIFFHIST